MKRNRLQQTTTRLLRPAVPQPAEQAACLVVVAGPMIGSEIKISDVPVVIGRDERCDFVLADAGVSRQHCRVARVDQRFMIEDLGSTNGCFVNGEMVAQGELRDGDRVRLGQCELKFFAPGSAEAGYHRELLQRAVVDSLTGFPNRRQFRELLDHAFDRGRRRDGAVQLMILDLDHFKPINDRYGHLVGDRVLAAFASTVRARLPTGVHVGRLGGEEFAIFAQDWPWTDFCELAEDLRRSVEAMSLTHEHAAIRVTISIGVARQQAEMTGAAELLRVADAQLYEAKKGGRNRVVG